MIQKIIFSFVTVMLSVILYAQPTNYITDREKKYKEVKDYFEREQYALA